MYLNLISLTLQGFSTLFLLVALGFCGLNIASLRSINFGLLLVLLLAFSIAFALNAGLVHGQYRTYMAEQIIKKEDIST